MRTPTWNMPTDQICMVHHLSEGPLCVFTVGPNGIMEEEQSSALAGNPAVQATLWNTTGISRLAAAQRTLSPADIDQLGEPCRPSSHVMILHPHNRLGVSWWSVCGLDIFKTGQVFCCATHRAR